MEYPDRVMAFVEERDAAEGARYANRFRDALTSPSTLQALVDTMSPAFRLTVEHVAVDSGPNQEWGSVVVHSRPGSIFSSTIGPRRTTTVALEGQRTLTLQGPACQDAYVMTYKLIEDSITPELKQRVLASEKGELVLFYIGDLNHPSFNVTSVHYANDKAEVWELTMDSRHHFVMDKKRLLYGPLRA